MPAPGADHRRLVGQIADVRRQRIVASVGVDPGEFDRSLGARGESLDQSLDFVGRRVFGNDRAAIGEAQVVEGVADRSRCGGDDEPTVVSE